MMLQHGLSEDNGYTVNQSLRLRASNSAYLSRIFATGTGNTKAAFRCFIKRGILGTVQNIFDVGSTGTDFTAIYFDTDNTIKILQYVDSAQSWLCTSSAVFRDICAHYDVLVVIDSTQATTSNRVILSVNGVTQTFSSATYPALNQNIYLFNGDGVTPHNIGRYSTTGNHLDAYVSEVYGIHGQSGVTHSMFGQTDPATGIWVPKKYTGTYGTNGFYLSFNDATSLTTLGYDRSGNGNNWTCNGISITAGATYDVMKDSPTNGPNEVGNYATLNPLDNRFMVGVISAANLQVSFNAPGASNLAAAVSTMPILSGSKVYFECVSSTASYQVSVGVRKVGGVPSSTQYFGYIADEFAYRLASGKKVNNNIGTAYGDTATSNDIIGCAVDLVAGKIWWSKNGVWQASGDPSIGTNPAYSTLSGDYYPAFGTEAGSNTCTCFVNFGQRPFAYTPPTGFKPLHTGNLPDATPVTTSGTFTGNASTDGPCVFINGTPTAMTINGNAVTFATHADKLAGGFKLRTSSASYNSSGTNTYSITTNSGKFKNARAQANP